jgi:hypothetical protein
MEVGAMPREQINYPSSTGVLIYQGNELDYQPGASVPEGGEVFADPALHVNWQSEGADFGAPHVQVSLEVPAGFLRSRAAGLDDSVSHTCLFTPVLTRQELNKLIRVLRTARDKAYGRDE